MTGDAPQPDRTMGDLYRVIWRMTRLRQVLLIGLSLLVAALAVVPLKFQQLVVNDLVYEGDVRWLAWLCAGLLASILLSAALKFALSLQLSIVGERVVLLIRERLYANYVADAKGNTDGVAPRGTLLTMLAVEAEVVGSFAGSAISTPLVQLGTLVSVIGFIAVSQPWLGLLALIVVVPQAVIILGIQRRINGQVRARAQSLRDASDRISATDPTQVEDEISVDFHRIFASRRRIFFLKLSSKFALSAISALGKVGILFLGGWLVLKGRSDVGTVVASLTGLLRIEGPWRDLVSFFRTASTARVKYEMLAHAMTLREPR